MPIKAENRAKYPKEWALISRLIRKYRADNNCECRGECGYNHETENARWNIGGRQCLARNGEGHPITRSKVVLTVAHIDQDPTNNREGKLLAM